MLCHLHSAYIAVVYFSTRHMIISSKLWLSLKFLSFFLHYAYSSVYFISPCVLRVPCHLITLIILILDTICKAQHCVRNIRRTPVSKYRANVLMILTGNWNWSKFQLISNQETEAIERPLTWKHVHFFNSYLWPK